MLTCLICGGDMRQDTAAITERLREAGCIGTSETADGGREFQFDDGETLEVGGTCNACDNCYLVCPEPCIVRDVRSNGLYKILVDYCKGCRVCIEECPTGCLEGVPELDFDTGVVRMDTAFAISPGLHGRQAEELKHLGDRAAKSI